MKRFSLVTAILILVAAISALAVPSPTMANVPAFSGILANARFAYVASYDGDQFDPNLLPEDRNAIGPYKARSRIGANSRSYTSPPTPTSLSL